jgi:uncharacterized RmlC-like cupin family protein
MGSEQRDGATASVRILRRADGLGALPGNWAASSFAELTHAPTGYPGLAAQTMLLPAGEPPAHFAADTHARLVWVLDGHCRIHWGESPPQVADAQAGDAILVAAGMPYQLSNPGSTVPLHCVVYLDTGT